MIVVVQPEPGVVIDGVMQERVARSMVRRRAGLVPVAGGPAHRAVSAAVRDTSEFLDVHVDQVPGVLVLVAADHPACGTVQPGQPCQPVPGQDPVHRGRVDTQQKTDPGRAHRRFTLSAMIRRSRRTDVRPGDLAGRLERSSIPCTPWSR